MREVYEMVQKALVGGRRSSGTIGGLEINAIGDTVTYDTRDVASSLCITLEIIQNGTISSDRQKRECMGRSQKSRAARTVRDGRCGSISGSGKGEHISVEKKTHQPELWRAGAKTVSGEEHHHEMVRVYFHSAKAEGR